jgi:hypothetical protein
MYSKSVTRLVTIVTVVVAALAALFGVFRLGEFVGEDKAQFSSHWGEHYQDNFFGPRRSLPGNLPLPVPEPPFLGAHGVTGPILSVSGNSVVIQGRDAEQVVLVGEDTVIWRLRDRGQFADLTVGERIAVIGKPDDQGRIEAAMIRIFPR